MAKISLDVRLTHGYVGTYKHLDKWMHIGTVDEIGVRELPLSEEQLGDMCDPRGSEIFAIVKLDERNEFHETWIGSKDYSPDAGAYEKWIDQQIGRALYDTYSQHDCAHEHDCCGCRSYSAQDAKRVTGDLWRLEVWSSRNY